MTWTSFVLPRHALSIDDLFTLCQLAPNLALCLDYDEVLAPLAPLSEAAHSSEKLLSVVTQFSQLPATEVIVFSGRSLDQLTTLLPTSRFTYIGAHGLVIRTADGETKRLLPEGAFTTIFTRLKHDLTAIVSSRSGCVVEDKRQVLALHYRLARPEDGEWAVAQAIALVTTYQRKGLALEILHGKKVLEVRLRGVNKGKALQSLVDLSEKTLLPIYIGDNETGEDAFQVLNRRGVTICVAASPRRTHARYYLRDPEEVATFLTRLLQARHSGAFRSTV